jgi:hypothetical protein
MNRASNENDKPKFILKVVKYKTPFVPVSVLYLFRCPYVSCVVCEHSVIKMHFNGQELLTPRPTPKLENHPLSAVRDCLFNIFAATLRGWERCVQGFGGET